MGKKKVFVLTLGVCALTVLPGLWIKALQDRGSSISCGVIGAADGPTSILVSCQTNEQLLYGMGAVLALLFAAVLYFLYLQRKHKI